MRARLRRRIYDARLLRQPLFQGEGNRQQCKFERSRGNLWLFCFSALHPNQ
jgi:hypothetical protein